VHGRGLSIRCLAWSKRLCRPVKAGGHLVACQQCNLLVDATHFEAEHPGESEERYVASLRRWRPARAKINLRRPNNVVNVLAANAETARRSRVASRSPFYFWMEEQLGRTDPVGDLAQDTGRIGTSLSRKPPTICCGAT